MRARTENYFERVTDGEELDRGRFDTEAYDALVENPFRLDDFAERIARLLRSPELRREMGAAGRARLEAHFTVERLADEFLEEYERARIGAGVAARSCR